MRKFAIFVALMALALGAMSWVGYEVLSARTRRWVGTDLALRSRLAVDASSVALSEAWSTTPEALEGVLSRITRDERITAGAACAGSELVAATALFPTALSCRSLRPGSAAPNAPPWSTVRDSSGLLAHLSAVSISVPGRQTQDFVLLLHDLGHLARRESANQFFVLTAFFVLALSASLVTLIAARFAFREWQKGLRAAIAGSGAPEFQPLLRDVRAMAASIAAEREGEASRGAWTAARLRTTLVQNLDGERVIVLANREPYVHERTASGIRVLHPASGLVTALEPVLKACSGVWVAHGSGSADRETSDTAGRIQVPPGENAYSLRRVWLSEEEEAGYYYGFANEGLWPLCHVAHARPHFRASDYASYEIANRRFAEAVCDEADSDNPVVLVQDYHFALAPRMIRERLPNATIIAFWHIPWPNAERIGICPWREELIAGLLGSSIIGFHTQLHCNNFIDAVDAFQESRIDREHRSITRGAHRTLIRPYPISIEWPVTRLVGVPNTHEARSEILSRLGLRDDALIGVGVDRLDYTKGLDERLGAVDELLDRYPEFRGRFVFVQLAAPSRTKIPRYQDLNDRIEKLVEEINRKWGYKAIVLLRSHHEPAAVFTYFRAANFCYVSSLHDGMNLVAKEFVAAREDERGVLILSEFTGAARELTEALIVNPYNLGQAAKAMAAALAMTATEQAARMRAMRSIVAEFNVFRWAGRMLLDAAEVRRKDRFVFLHPEK